MRLALVTAALWLVVVPITLGAPATSFDRSGISFAYPSGWHVTTKPLSNLRSPRFRFTVATFEPRRTLRDEGPCLAGVAHQRGARGTYAYLLEALGTDRKLDRFPPRRPGLFHLPARGQMANCDGRWSRWVPFRQAGRAFYLGISVGPQASPETRAQLRRILAGLEIRRR